MVQLQKNVCDCPQIFNHHFTSWIGRYLEPNTRFTIEHLIADMKGQLTQAFEGPLVAYILMVYSNCPIARTISKRAIWGVGWIWRFGQRCGHWTPAPSRVKIFVDIYFNDTILLSGPTRNTFLWILYVFISIYNHIQVPKNTRSRLSVSSRYEICIVVWIFSQHS